MKEKTRTVLFWFILIQPFLDLYWFYNANWLTSCHSLCQQLLESWLFLSSSACFLVKNKTGKNWEKKNG